MPERYEIKETLGRGGYGVVYVAYDNTLKRDVAVKRVHIESTMSPEALAKSLSREAEALSALRHPNIITILDIQSDEEGAFLVMEKLDGSDLLKYIKESPAFTLEEFWHFAEESLDALVAADSVNILHRDLKPSNIFVTKTATGLVHFKLLDFGLAKFSATPAVQSMDHKNQLMGSIHYMSPEQIEQNPLDARSDLYSLGCCWYLSLTGQHPFDGESAAVVMAQHLTHQFTPLNEIREDLPKEVVALVHKMIALEPNQRPASPSAAFQELKKAKEAASGTSGKTAHVPVVAGKVKLSGGKSLNVESVSTSEVEALKNTAKVSPKISKKGFGAAAGIVAGAVTVAALAFAGIFWYFGVWSSGASAPTNSQTQPEPEPESDSETTAEGSVVELYPGVIDESERLEQLEIRSKMKLMGEFATRDNVKILEGAEVSLEEWRQELAEAFARGAGGVYNFERGWGKWSQQMEHVIPFGEHQLVLVPSKLLWQIGPPEVKPSSGKHMISGRFQGRSSPLRVDLKIDSAAPHSKIVKLGMVVLSRAGQSGAVELTAITKAGTELALSHDFADGTEDNRCFVFTAPAGEQFVAFEMLGKGPGVVHFSFDDVGLICE